MKQFRPFSNSLEFDKEDIQKQDIFSVGTMTPHSSDWAHMGESEKERLFLIWALMTNDGRKAFPMKSKHISTYPPSGAPINQVKFYQSLTWGTSAFLGLTYRA